jgi:two-component system CheB/CheR fusion protein
VATIQDISEAKAWEAHQVLLLRELSHRVKNTLTIILSMARQTLRADTSPTALQKFEDRLFALSSAHDLLVQSDWKGAEIGAIVHRVLAAYPAAAQGRIAIEGPEFLLPHHLATPFAMLVHELATNAFKFGALGEHGNVSVTWRIVLQRSGKSLEVLWEESGGPPIPMKRTPGFGTFIIEKVLPDAEVQQCFEAGGLVCKVEFPI